MTSDLLSFYKDANVLLTGGTGFLGKVVIEKLLRTTEVRTIFLLTRPKRGRNVGERVVDIFASPLFEPLLRSRPDVDQTRRITAISGDCSLPDLGLSAADRETLAQQVDVVIHSAATVRFNEPLATALAINVRATIDLLRLAKEMPRLKAFVHVSSAFANCTERHIGERFYTSLLRGRSAAEVCRLADELGDEALQRRCDELVGDFPNTYCYTKALAEEAVLAQGHGLPICVFRPGIVTHSSHDPMSGWIDNIYGPMSIVLGVGLGILHVLYAHMESEATLVPVDYCANAMLACVWDAVGSKASATTPPAIYNLVPDDDNLLKWSDYNRNMKRHGLKMPLARMIWYPFLITTDSKWRYALYTFLCHTVPGYAMDLALLLTGQKRRMVRTYQKIHEQTAALHYFVENRWSFGVTNTKLLWRRLSGPEQAIFPFDMGAINWSDYFYYGVSGIRLYLGKEKPDTIPKSLQRLTLFRWLHRTLKTVICGSALYMLVWASRHVMSLCV